MESADLGKTIKMASTVDIPRSVANFRFFAGQLRHGETGAWAMHEAINYSVRCPIGPCALICPWNLPLYQLSWKVAPAIACGNSVIAKQATRVARAASVAVQSGSSSMLRSFGPLGPALAKRQSNIKATQDFFAHKAADTYFAKSSDNIMVKGTLAFTALMFSCTLLGMYDAVTGSNKKELA